MKPKRNILAILSVFGLAVLLVLGYTLSSRNSSLEGMREVESYDNEGICLAMTPECGVCPEKVIGDKCYVQKGTYEDFE